MKDYCQIHVVLLPSGPPNLTLRENDPIRSSDIDHVLYDFGKSHGGGGN